ncbi:hypothetical protein [Enterobacter cloacae]|uniref:hypothetical protein n=1 Tax=Enterobacter cloacae TaxID=550 RepID=UPI001F5E9B61|nr:hypothetical protein [Enterobacter cloacae]
MSYLEGTREKQVQFYNNLTVFNRNFAAFLEAVKRVNPEAEIKAVSLFNLWLEYSICGFLTAHTANMGSEADGITFSCSSLP